MLRKMLCSLMASLALFLPVAMPLAQAQHGHTPHRTGHTRTYWLYYRTCPQDVWRCYGGYYDVNRAQQAVNWFRSNGYEAFYR